ncbi:MAG: hypothetical protein ACD_49C00060G0009 [uncultured bacterium (gcode 4)]|uniref:Uncharacterized protein n=1 Tax=uncultured bacterium (gcode 4) TaxID=1234023 RepID=K2AWM9_9BACT|nr:MAG: hypothetical protein ACD_49C00060G0009 [uncultured bacterium (gcode 4)]
MITTKKYIGLAIAISLISVNAFAETWSILVDPLDSEAPVEVSASWSEVTAAWTEETDLNAATPEVMVPTWAVSNYEKVACDKEFFIQNTCSECFAGWNKNIWEKITSLNDSWTNPNTTEQIIYSDEQTFPELVNLWGDTTKWLTSPEDNTKFWKISQEIIWNDSKTGSGRQEFLLEWGKTVNLYESDLWATYTVDSTDKKEWEAIGLLKFPLAYHNIDATWKEWEKMNHTECVAYYAGTPVVAPVAPAEVTKVKTWPQSLILILMALILSFFFLRLRKKA